MKGQRYVDVRRDRGNCWKRQNHLRKRQRRLEEEIETERGRDRDFCGKRKNQLSEDTETALGRERASCRET